MPTVSQLEQLLGRVFDGAREGLREDLDPEEYEKRKHDFIFHMTDWKDDLERLAALFNNPDPQGEEAASVLLIGFLYHAVPHLNAAGRLLLDDIGDPFSQAKGREMVSGAGKGRGKRGRRAL
jgi:hypothetical protein